MLFYNIVQLFCTVSNRVIVILPDTIQKMVAHYLSFRDNNFC